MGEFEAGKWIIAILIYFIIFFTLNMAVLNAKALVLPDQTRLDISDPGAIGLPNINEREFCAGRGVGSILSNVIPCKRLEVQNDEAICNEIAGCEWFNATSLFNISILNAGCFDNVNLTHYDINGSHRHDYCDFLTNESICNAFKCTWQNQSTSMPVNTNIASTQNIVNLWETIKFVTGFRTDLGLGQFSFIYSFIFFWIPFVVMLGWAIYMALPFFH